MKRVVPKISLANGKLLTLRELSRSKEAAIVRKADCLRRWIESGVRMQEVIVHLPHLRIGKYYYSSLSGLLAFLEVLQDVSHAETAALADKMGPPVVGLRGDVFKEMG